jgi:hypothetical protein
VAEFPTCVGPARGQALPVGEHNGRPRRSLPFELIRKLTTPLAPFGTFPLPAELSKASANARPSLAVVSTRGRGTVENTGVDL